MKKVTVIIATLFLVLFSNFILGQKEKFLIAKYSFNEGKPLDDLGKHHPKVYGAILGPDRFGNNNSAYVLQGSYASFINLGTSNELKPKAATISMWFYMNFEVQSGKGVPHNPILFTRSRANEDFNDAYNIIYRLDDKTISCANTISELKQVAISSVEKVSLREWHHVAICYDQQILTLYFDGKHVATLNKNFENQFLEGDSIMVGYRAKDKNERFFCGSVDDIEIYNKVLSSEEIQELYKARNPNLLTIILTWATVVILIIALFRFVTVLIRRRLQNVIEREKEKNSQELRLQEQEIKMLKAQMDPHFIFNSLNTIQQFIITKENDKAELYLSKFSKLIRKLLDSNTRESISLADELEILNGYLEIESLRFNSKIDTKIVIGEGIDTEQINIPHMMIQPFVENAIWHGLRLKEGEKKLTLRFERKDDLTLFCVIEDNGVGRKGSTEARQPAPLKRSLAISFINQRLELLSKTHKKNYCVKLIDKTDENKNSLGTRVEITLPIIIK